MSDILPPGEPRITRFMGKAGLDPQGKQKYKFYPTKIWTVGDYYFIDSVMAVKDEIKAMKGSHWCGYDKAEPMKLWRVTKCRRNDFAIAYLEGLNPYARYKTPLEDKDGQGFRIRRTRKTNTGEVCEIREHQIEMILHMLIRRQCIVAGEMGTGKTLAAFEAIELSLVPFVWYIAPRSALNSVRLEAQKWQLRTNVRFMTYDELKNVLKNWKAGDKPPTFVVCDESSRVKNPTSQRSQAVEYLAEAMRAEYGDKCYIIEMSGSPSPKEPTDWYHQCEIACPGYILEGDLHKFRARLAVQAEQTDIVGYNFKKIVAWRDGRNNVCNMCGRPMEHECHDMTPKEEDDGLFGKPRTVDKAHPFVPLANEVNNLYKRMSGLALVKLKKDCLSLPDKQYRVVKLKPSLDLLRAARIVQSQAKTAIQQMTLLRELSDGFQYRDNITKTSECTFCGGNCFRFVEGVEERCMMCEEGKMNETKREVIEVESPKINYLTTELLEENEEIGRLVIYGGFTGSIDRICREIKKRGWEFIRVDGRGWNTSLPGTWSALQMLTEFQNKDSKFDKLAFVGHPGSAGMGLTLTAASMIVYYSNDFNAESRIQSEDRIHRMGMDENRGATIVDLICLPTDLKVLENLRRKRELQSVTLNEISKAMDEYDFNDAILV